MSWPAIIFIGLYIFNIGISITKDGKPRDGNHSFALTFFSTIVSAGLLYWGGFFA